MEHEIGIGAAQPCLRKYLTDGNARETEISPVQSRRRSLGFYKIRKNGAPGKRGCRTNVPGMDSQTGRRGTRAPCWAAISRTFP